MPWSPPSCSHLTKSEPGEDPARKVLVKLGAESVNETYGHQIAHRHTTGATQFSSQGECHQ
jgi:hypothetical protein